MASVASDPWRPVLHKLRTLWCEIQAGEPTMKTVVAKKVSKKQFEIPAEGPVMATLVEVRDLGEVATGYGKKQKVLFIWDTDETDEGGAQLKVFERLTNTLHPQGRLAPRIKSITGEFPDEDEDYNLTGLEGSRVQLVIEHNRTEDGVYANIA